MKPDSKQIILEVLKRECLTNRQISERTNLTLACVTSRTQRMVKSGDLLVVGFGEVPKGRHGYMPPLIYGLNNDDDEEVKIVIRDYVPPQCRKQTWYSPLTESQ